MTKKVGLFGGTFNPPHKGHLNAAVNFCNIFSLSTLYIVPTFITPLKSMSKDDSPKNRSSMAKLCFKQEYFKNTEIKHCDYEIEKQEKSYTIDTVDYLLQKENVERIYIFVGSDMFLTLENWKNSEELFKKCIFVTCPRDEDILKEQNLKKEVYRSKYNALCVVMDISPLKISSTQIRADFLKSKNLPEFTQFKNVLTDDVFCYIIKEKLYFDEDLSKINEISRQLSKFVHGEKRLAHIYSTEQRANFIVGFFENQISDFEKFRNQVKIAALLHDITKEISPDEQLLLYKKYNIEITDDDIFSFGVRHARTGAYKAKEIFNIDDMVFSAIYNHTTGKENMSLIEKIIFIADYTEKTRNFPHIIELREKIDNDLYMGHGEKALDKAILISMDMTIKYLNLNNQKIHNDMIKAKEFLEKRC